MSTEQGVPPESQPGSLDEIPLSVSLEFGRASISLRELRTLEPGYIFSTGSGFEEPVIARVNGVVIGRGELVRVGDSLGVRLTRVNDHAS